MSEFKPGDKVKCINNKNCKTYFKLNKIYTVSNVLNTGHYLFLSVKEVSAQGWSIDRFKLINPISNWQEHLRRAK